MSDVSRIPSYQTDPLPFANYRDMLAQPGLGLLTEGLLDPTVQRLNVILGLSFGIADIDPSTEQAIGELNHHYGFRPQIGEVARAGYLQTVDEELDSPEGVAFALDSTKAALLYMDAVARLFMSYDPLANSRVARDNALANSLAAGVVEGGLATVIRRVSDRPLGRAQTAETPSTKWQGSVDKSVGFLRRVLSTSFDASAAKGIVNLGSVLGDVARGSAQKAVDGSRTTTYFTPPPRERHPELAPPKLAKPDVVAPTPEANDSEATRLLEELDLQPLGSKALKGHPLFAVLKKGAEVTLGTVHRFGGFGDNAGFAAAFVDRMASIVEGSEPEAIETLAQQVAEAKRLVTTRITPEAKHALALFVDVATQCSQHNFCQVAKNHAPQVHPTVRLAVQRLTLLREQMSLQKS